MRNLEQHFEAARERYAELGVDVATALEILDTVPLSIHCWQGDDVQGFEDTKEAIGGGLAVTGHHPGRARSVEELRADLDMAMSLIPGRHRVNLHASYGEFPQPVDRDQVEPSHFHGWIDWARDHQCGLDFNPTYFAHPHASDGFTLSHTDPHIRSFWIEHGMRCRRIAATMGQELASPCVNNVWIPDGMKDLPADRVGPRERLTAALDEVFSEPLPTSAVLDAVECKLFGLGSESYVVGSHEFYLLYAASRQKVLCLDTGHFHPTELVSDKLSAVLGFLDRVLLHISRGVRWDSDHVVILSDELRTLTRELVRGSFLDRVHIGLDFFDASINRVAAWVIGTRNVRKALLIALLEPYHVLQTAERNGDFTRRLALSEELHGYPWGAIWDYYCLTHDVPVGPDWLPEVQRYEASVLGNRTD